MNNILILSLTSKNVSILVVRKKEGRLINAKTPAMIYKTLLQGAIKDRYSSKQAVGCPNKLTLKQFFSIFKQLIGILYLCLGFTTLILLHNVLYAAHLNTIAACQHTFLGLFHLKQKVYFSLQIQMQKQIGIKSNDNVLRKSSKNKFAETWANKLMI